ncbi:PDZ domain-containing protein, partial [Enterobacter hormaechei]|uniref:S1C family serine protease n=1 Tax=Enterobacter hormaechei TaxID=158836 RepID=UPI00256F4781
AEQLETTGHVVRGRIAVEIADVSPDVAAALGLPKAEGALVSNVEAGGPADAAGIQAGDIILRFDGRPVELGTDLQRMVGDTKP